MNLPKLKQTSTKVLLAISGAAYLAIFSNSDLNIFVRCYVVIVPVQLLALIYGLHLIYQQKANTKQYRTPDR